jgi:hypothetical protein
MSSFLSGGVPTNLFSFDNQDVVENTSQFGAFNFSQHTSSKLSISVFYFFRKFWRLQTESKNDYLQNSTIAFEDRLKRN